MLCSLQCIVRLSYIKTVEICKKLPDTESFVEVLNRVFHLCITSLYLNELIFYQCTLKTELWLLQYTVLEQVFAYGNQLVCKSLLMCFR